MANMPDQSIGFDGPKARILCQSHNSRLSPLDSEAKKLADGLHQFVDGAEHTTVHLSGLLLERWTLKTVINYLASEGMTSLGAVAEALNERGMLKPRGGRWHKSSVRNLLNRLGNSAASE